MSKMEFNDNVYQKAVLILKYLRGEATEREKSALREWIAESEENRRFMESLENDKDFNEEYEFFSELDVTSAWSNLEKQTIKAQASQPRRSLWRYAAVISLLFVSTVVLYTIINEEGNLVVTAQNGEPNDIAPGRDKA